MSVDKYKGYIKGTKYYILYYYNTIYYNTIYYKFYNSIIIDLKNKKTTIFYLTFGKFPRNGKLIHADHLQKLSKVRIDLYTFVYINYT